MAQNRSRLRRVCRTDVRHRVERWQGSTLASLVHPSIEVARDARINWLAAVRPRWRPYFALTCRSQTQVEVAASASDAIRGSLVTSRLPHDDRSCAFLERR